MTSYTFFLKNARKIASMCSVQVTKSHVTLWSVYNSNSATYSFRNRAERAQIIRILEGMGVNFAYTVEDDA